jgi:hypothetical protein
MSSIVNLALRASYRSVWICIRRGLEKAPLSRSSLANHDRRGRYGGLETHLVWGPVTVALDSEDGSAAEGLIGSLDPCTLGNGRPLERSAYEHVFGVSIERDFGALLERLRGAELVEEAAPGIALTELESSSTTVCCSASTRSAPSAGCETGPPRRKSFEEASLSPGLR